MMMRKKKIETYVPRMGCRMAVALAALSLASCIDEDLSDCGADYAITYTLRLHTNLRAMLDDELRLPEEQAIAGRLETALAGVFTDRAADIDLSFYTGGALSHHESHAMDASSASYTIYLPVADYDHAAVANDGAEPLVTLAGAGSYGTLRLEQAEADTIDGHTAGLFTACRRLTVADGTSRTFNVDLYMQNCAAALVIDLNGHNPSAISGHVEGMACAFSIADSTFDFSRSTMVRASRLDDGAGRVALYAAGFPSVSSPQESAGAATPSAVALRAGQAGGHTSTLFTQRSEPGSALWLMRVYITENGSTTESTLSVSEPLPAGSLKVIKARIGDGGQVVTDAPEVGVSVKLDWKPGGSHDVEM